MKQLFLFLSFLNELFVIFGDLYDIFNIIKKQNSKENNKTVIKMVNIISLCCTLLHLYSRNICV